MLINKLTLQHNIYLLGGEEVDAESPTGSRTVNRVTRYFDFFYQSINKLTYCINHCINNEFK